VYWSPLEHILTEFRVISRYLFLFVLPLPRFLVFDWDGFPISNGLFDPVTTIFSIGLLSAIVIFSICNLRKTPFLSFGILWYFIAISLESFIAVGSALYFEHRNYLPLAGLSFGLVAQFASFFGKRIKWKYALWVFFIIVSAFLGFLTFQRNYIWKDPVTFWKDPVQKTRGNIRATLVLANSYFSISDFKNAKSYYVHTIRIARERGAYYFTLEALYRLGLMNLVLEQSSEGRKIIDELERISPDSNRLKILKGHYSYLNHDIDDAINTYLYLLGAEKIKGPDDKGQSCFSI
jgi:tetratricopeptide (TPR) repeat protein